MVWAGVGSRFAAATGPKRWFIGRFGCSESEAEVAAESVELGAAIHRALQQRETTDPSLGLPAGPGRPWAGAGRGPVVPEAGGKAPDHAMTPRAGVARPRIEGGDGTGLGPGRSGRWSRPARADDMATGMEAGSGTCPDPRTHDDPLRASRQTALPPDWVRSPCGGPGVTLVRGGQCDFAGTVEETRS